MLHQPNPSLLPASPTPVPSPQLQQKQVDDSFLCGLYQRGSTAGLPLHALSVKAQVTGTITHVQVEQRFFNDQDVPIEAL